MANRFWRGNGGNIDDTAHWSTSSGGAGGASVPTLSDNATFDSNSFSSSGQTVTVPDGVTFECINMDWSAVTNSPRLHMDDPSGTNIINIYGNLVLNSNMTFTTDSTSNSLSFVATSGSKTITTAAITIPCVFDLNGSGGTWTLQDDLTIAINCSLTARDGTFNTNGKTVTIPRKSTFQISGSAVNFGSSTINVSASAGDNADFSFNSGTLNTQTSTIVFSNTGSGYWRMLDSSGTGVTYNAITVSGQGFFSDVDYTITTLTLSAGTNVQFGFGNIITTTTFVANGTSGSHIVMDSDDPGVTQFTLVSTNVTANYLDVADCVASGSTPFTSIGGIDNGNNTNWVFSSPSTPGTPGAIQVKPQMGKSLPLKTFMQNVIPYKSKMGPLINYPVKLS